MISQKMEFNSYLDKLRYYIENYGINVDGIVVDKEGNEINDEKIIINTKFIVLYCLAYKNYIETIINQEINNISEEYFERVLTDYDTFNSVMNICVNEYHIYNNIGTDNIVYYPYEKIINYIIQNDVSKIIFMNYINYEIDNVNNLENGKKLVKKNN